MVLLTEEMIVARAKTSNLESITKLNCWGSELSDVSILRKLKNLTVVSLSVNNIASLESLQFCTKLQEIFLRKNNVSDLNQVCYLQGLPDLKSLWLKDNPCATDAEDYRLAVIRALPNLKTLDEAPVESSEADKAQSLGRLLVHPDQQQEEYYESDEEYESENILSVHQNNREENGSPPLEIKYRRSDQYYANSTETEPTTQYQRTREYNNSYEHEEDSNSRQQSQRPQVIQRSRNQQPDRSPSPESQHNERHSPETNGQYIRVRDLNNSAEHVNDQHSYNNDNGDTRDIYNEPANQNHRQSTTLIKYEEESSARQQNHRLQGILPRSRTTDGELGHFSCPTCTIPQQTYRRPLERRTNVLNAVLCLVKELDYPNLEVVQMAVKCRMEELCDNL